MIFTLKILVPNFKYRNTLSIIFLLEKFWSIIFTAEMHCRFFLLQKTCTMINKYYYRNTQSIAFIIEKLQRIFTIEMHCERFSHFNVLPTFFSVEIY